MPLISIAHEPNEPRRKRLQLFRTILLWGTRVTTLGRYQMGTAAENFSTESMLEKEDGQRFQDATTQDRVWRDRSERERLARQPQAGFPPKPPLDVVPRRDVGHASVKPPASVPHLPLKKDGTLRRMVFQRCLLLYGSSGILLRELIMLTSPLRYAFAESCIYTHWSSNGDLTLVPRNELDDTIFGSMSTMALPNQLQELERQLNGSGCITINFDQAQAVIGHNQKWSESTRSWCAVSLQQEYHTMLDACACNELLALYSQMPDRDTHPLAERHREMFYPHAHRTLRWIIKIAQVDDAILANMDDRFLDVALNVLGHRYQRGDKPLIHFVWRRYIDWIILHRRRRSLFTYSDRLRHSTWTDKRIMLELIVFQANVDRVPIGPGSQKSEIWLHKTLETFRGALDNKDRMSVRAWGMLGYALVEMLDTSETAKEYVFFNEIIEMVKTWCLLAAASQTPIETAVLCRAYVRIRDFDSLSRLPNDTRLACGYSLSRAGFLHLAADYLSAGLERRNDKWSKAITWRYQLEFWNVQMRLGNWREAEQWLSNTLMGLEHYRWKHGSLPNDLRSWIMSGEYIELRMSISCLLSDCYIAADQLSEAAELIQHILPTTHDGMDNFRISTHLILNSRLLNVQMELEHLDNAVNTATGLCNALQRADTTSLTPETISSMIQEVLACVNELSHSNMHQEAINLIRFLEKTINEAHPESFLSSYVHDDVKLYVNHRRIEIESGLDPRAMGVKVQHSAASSALETTSAPPKKKPKISPRVIDEGIQAEALQFIPSFANLANSSSPTG